MALRVFNTLTRQKEEFVPLNPPDVGMYVCGVTVYDVCHIGHARAYVAFDVVRRYLEWRGYRVRYVRNFTDVDDKIIARAHEQGVGTLELADKYIEEFWEDMRALGVGRADVEPRVTRHIPQITETIQTIIANGYAYQADGDVYFHVPSFPGYLRLSGRRMEKMMAGARVEPGENKRHPMDFALWKRSKPGEPAWDSPWGPGRPGWHIECSTMSTLYLGEVFDIHGGGMDLIFPHHENERAQSYAASGKEFVRYWMHNGFVQVRGEKMAKSLKNFFTIKEVTAEYHPEALRYFLLTTHYRSPINFTREAIREAEERVEYLYETMRAARESQKRDGGEPSREVSGRYLSEFQEHMDDDFNTAAALGVVANCARLLNECLRKKGAECRVTVASLLQALEQMGGVLGLCERDPDEVLSGVKERRIARHGIDVALVEEKIARRAEARRTKRFADADAIRDELARMGVILMDTPHGTLWKVK